MIHLASYTSECGHVIYDPAATGHIDMEKPWIGTNHIYMYGQDEGVLLFHDSGKKGYEYYQVYVNEELPEELLQRWHKKTEGLLLKIPSGNLVVGGMEYLNDREKLDSARKWDISSPDEVQRNKIPPGNYLVDVYEFNRRMDKGCINWKWIGYELAIRLGCLFSLVGLYYLGYSLYVSIHYHMSLVDSWPFWAISLGTLIGPWLFTTTKFGEYGKKQRRTALEDNFFALHFKHLPEDANLLQYKGGEFGRGEKRRASGQRGVAP